MKKIPLADSVGRRLAHDITEVRPGEFKGPAFRRGHVVSADDLCRLQKIGRNHLYELELADDEIHEDDAAALLAGALAAEGVGWVNAPREGRIELLAERDGLLEVDADLLEELNMTGDLMCATLHDGTFVHMGEVVGATRAIPLVMGREAVVEAAGKLRGGGGVLRVRPLRRHCAGLLVTGSEVVSGLVEDGFAPRLRGKIAALGSAVTAVLYAPDDADAIAARIKALIGRGCDLILVSGGMSVDPDDVTRGGIALAGAAEIHYGAAALPGAMFLVARIGEVPLLGVPACALHHRVTVLDLVLPRVLAGERIGRKELAALGHGGLCRGCPECSWPRCAFGR